MQTALSDSNLVVPRELQAALASNKTAAELFEDLAPSHRKEYIDWIASAKQETTRRNRAGKALELICRTKVSG